MAALLVAVGITDTLGVTGMTAGPIINGPARDAETDTAKAPITAASMNALFIGDLRT